MHDDDDWDKDGEHISDDTVDVDYAKSKVSGPAIALLIVTAIGLVTIVLCIAFDGLILAGGLDHLNRKQFRSERPQILVRFVWSLFILVSNIVTIVGAFKMKQLQNPTLSYAACILSVIPCLGPCCIFGIPFGIWGLIALSDPDVKRAFSLNEPGSPRPRL